MSDPPISFFYSRLHDGIRHELSQISEDVQSFQPSSEAETVARLQTIQRKLIFLGQVYNYHSVAEDEVREIAFSEHSHFM